MEAKSEGVKEVLENMEGTAEAVEESTAEEPGRSEETVAGEPETAKESIAEEPETARENPAGERDAAEESTVEEPETTAKAAIAKEEKDHKGSQGNEGTAGRKKIAGWVELAVSCILAALSVWLFLNTRGTRLLYVSVATGCISRYYWGFLAAAAVFVMFGAVTLKRVHRKERKNLPEHKKT